MGPPSIERPFRIARPLGLDPATAPILDARLDDGSRVAICVPSAAPHVAITIRRFGKRSYSPEDLVRFGSLPIEVLDEARAALLGRRNILVSGGTGSGKTTLLNALVELLPPTTALFPSRTPWSSASRGKTVSASRHGALTANR